MTVSYLRAMQRQQPTLHEPEVRRHRYRSGFNECANQVMEFLGGDNAISDDVKSRLGAHLVRCTNVANQGHSDMFVGGNISPSKCYGEQLAIDIPDTKQTTSGPIVNGSDRLLLPIRNQHVMDKTLSSTFTCNTRSAFQNIRETEFSNGYPKCSPSFVNSYDSNMSSAISRPGHFESNCNVDGHFHIDRSDQINNNDNVWRPW